MTQPGLFFSLEGLEACGKTTLAKEIVNYLQSLGYTTYHQREPGGTVPGEKIREILIHDNLVPQAELLLFMAGRLQIVETIAKPALAKGSMIVSERFQDSTYALQGFGRDLFDQVQHLDVEFLKGFQPTRTYYLDISVQTSNSRQSGRKQDRFETAGDAFHEKVKEGFDYRLRTDEDGRILHINGERPLYEILDIIYEDIDGLIAAHYLPT